MSVTKKPYETDRIVSGKELAGCFEKLKETLGKAMVETIAYELEIMYGILFVGKLSYNLSEVNDALTKLLGDSASEIMMESIVDVLIKNKVARTRHISMAPARQHLKSGKNEIYGRRYMAARKNTSRKKRLMKRTRQNRPVPAWVVIRTNRKVRTNPKRRLWRRSDVNVG